MTWWKKKDGQDLILYPFFVANLKVNREQEVSYVDSLISKETEEQELAPTTTTTTNTEAEEISATNEPALVTTTSSRKPSKITQQKELQETISSKSISKQLDKQTIHINKKIIQILQPLQSSHKS
jgi:hypothetical protein